MADFYTPYQNRTSSRSFSNGKWSESVAASSSSVRTGTETRSSTRTPGYFTLLRDHKSLPENPYSHVGAQMDLCPMTVVKSTPTTYFVGEYGHSSLVNLVVTGITPSSGEFRKLGAEVKSLLISRMKADDWSLPVFVGELAESAGMVSNRAITLARLMENLRRGKFIDFLSELANPPPRDQWKRRNSQYQNRYRVDPRKASASAWLEYSYGWRPLIQDVASAVNAVMSSVDRQVDLAMTVSASRKRTLRSSQSVVNSLVPQGSIYVDYRVDTENHYSVRGKVRYRARAADLPGRFGLLNPLSVAWELVPLSFVADWFLPIGDYLSSFDTNLRFDVVGGHYGYKLETRRNVEIVQVRTQGASVTLSHQANKCVSVLREPFSGNLGLTLRDIWALKRVPDTVGQALSAISLLSQRARSW